MDAHQSDKLDLYSVPVFVLELVILVGLAFAAHHIHFQYKHEPYLTGFYCDDISIRHEFRESQLTEQFLRPDNELVLLSLLLVVPVVVIIFCELVNSMFGSLKFRKVRAMCKCCKLHSITRRTIRFSGAYILGFLLVMISCDILASTTGKFKPYFAQECPNAFKTCLVKPSGAANANQGLGLAAALEGGSGALLNEPTPITIDTSINNSNANSHPNSQPIQSNATTAVITPLSEALVRARRDVASSIDKRLLERQWVILEGVNLAKLCDFSGDAIQTRKFERLSMSWPSFPAAIVTYAALYVAAYLCFVGTARPFRVITSVLVVALLLVATVFDVELIREHFNHWEDSLSGAVLALLVVILVLFVYLNKFRDTHYYENQKLPKRRHEQNISNGYSNEIAMEQYNLDKTEDEQGSISNMNNNNNNSPDAAGSVPNNDLAMRYFQIPRANYRGGPRQIQ